MEQLARADLDTVRRVIAGERLRGVDVDHALGAITLHPHQIDAVRRVRMLLARHGGALLCDEVGLGKTYVALAVTRTYTTPVIVAPASLQGMWQAAANGSGIDARILTTESLSRRAHKNDALHDLVVVDEAHHFRTPSTARYRSLAKLCARAPVLLVSATPLHNGSPDVTALLALFLGSAARRLSDSTVARFVVRRSPDGLRTRCPKVAPAAHVSVRCDAIRLHQLLALPPPVPPREGGFAAALVAQNLVRLWASSDAALREGLRRRLAKTVAIRAALEAGRYPTAAELRSWQYTAGSVQLGFTQLLSADGPPDPEMLAAVSAHEAALAGVLGSIPRRSAVDCARVKRLRAIRARHEGARVIAFSQFAETVAMYYRELNRDGRVAMLTARGGTIASGPITRREALERFAPRAQGVKPPRPSEEITLLVTTDLLSEGVNLQDASVVAHLDLPWTAAALEQRVGRAARLDSSHAAVFVYAFDPPAPSEEILRAEATIRGKAALTEASIGSSRIPPLFVQPSQAPSPVENAEAIRRLLDRWATLDGAVCLDPVIAAVVADREGMLALLSVRGEPVLVAGGGSEISADARTVRELLEIADGPNAVAQDKDVRATVARLNAWMSAKLASIDAGNPSVGQSHLARKLGSRLARILAGCPRHERALCSRRVAAVQTRLQSPFTLGAEWEVGELLKSGPTDFLARLEKIISPRIYGTTGGATGIRAVLVLKRRTPAVKNR